MTNSSKSEKVILSRSSNWHLWHAELTRRATALEMTDFINYESQDDPETVLVSAVPVRPEPETYNPNGFAQFTQAQM